MRSVLAVLACAGIAASAAQAGTVTSSGTVALFGNSYGITTWGIAGDAGPASTAFGAEGMTYLGGTLYVSHDHDANRAAGNLVTYAPGAGGDLSAPATILMGSGPAGLWGPEGITVNTSGAGFGASATGATLITGVETRGTDAFGVFDPAAPGSNISPAVNAAPALDDVAWVGSRSQFAGVEDGAVDTSFLRFFDHTASSMTVTAFSAPVINGSKGIAAISAAFAQALTGSSIATSQALVVVSEFGFLAVYDTDGNLVGSAQDLSGYMPITELESVAVDEANLRLFLGDEAGLSIHTVQIPAPGSAALLMMGAAAGLRRRRR